MKKNGILITIVALLSICCLCLGCLGLTAAGAFGFVSSDPFDWFESEEQSQLPQEEAVQIPTRQPSQDAETPTPEPAQPTEPSTQLQTELIPSEIAVQMDTIQQQVIRLRGLRPNEDVDRKLMSAEELKKRVDEDFLKDYTPDIAQEDGWILSAFGLLEPEFDLYRFYSDLYAEQVAGFYDSETKEMYVVQGEDFGAPERLTYAHEYTHFLQDQNYDMQNGLNINDDTCEEDSEYCLAVSSLIEGDASFVEQFWFFRYATDEEREEIQAYYEDMDLPVYDNAPAYIREDFSFPYDAGFEFVQYLYEQGKWSAIDAAFENPPVSSEQILHPERYPDDQPVEINLPELEETLGSDYRLIDDGVMGEWYTYLILAQGYDSSFRLSEEQASKAAEGWGGDAYAVYWSDEINQAVVVMQTEWDETQDAQEFFDAFNQYGMARWGGPESTSSQQAQWTTKDGEVILIQRQGNQTLWLMVPDGTILDTIIGQFVNFSFE